MYLYDSSFKFQLYMTENINYHSQIRCHGKDIELDEIHSNPIEQGQDHAELLQAIPTPLSNQTQW